MDHPLSPFQKSDGGKCLYHYEEVKEQVSIDSRLTYEAKDTAHWISVWKRGMCITPEMVRRCRYPYPPFLCRAILL